MRPICANTSAGLRRIGVVIPRKPENDVSVKIGFVLPFVANACIDWVANAWRISIATAIVFWGMLACPRILVGYLTCRANARAIFL
jgi:hypothetical protein